MIRWITTAFSTYVLHPLKGNGYQWWSGAGSDLTYLGILAVWLRKHNCHRQGCWRIQWHVHPTTGELLCKRHHPHG